MFQPYLDEDSAMPADLARTLATQAAGASAHTHLDPQLNRSILSSYRVSDSESRSDPRCQKHISQKHNGSCA